MTKKAGLTCVMEEGSVNFVKLTLRKAKRIVLPKTPKFIKRLLKQTRYYLFYKGQNRWCPVCEKNSKIFLPTGKNSRKDAMCSFCGSVERHRFEWCYLKNSTDLFDDSNKKILHVAPEDCLEKKLKKLGESYITADLYNPQAMVKMDITNIQYPDGYFDVILCSHVLEHVPNDRKAISEFFRVLKNDGWALLAVPITSETKKTFEYPSINDPEERLKYFSQEDHVRRYGMDFVDRLNDSGFLVKKIVPMDYFTDKEIIYMGMKSSNLFYCTKQA